MNPRVRHDDGQDDVQHSSGRKRDRHEGVVALRQESVRVHVLHGRQGQQQGNHTEHGGDQASCGQRRRAVRRLHGHGVPARAAGGWLGDRLLGERQAVMYGGVVITIGHLCLAVPISGGAYAGLVVIAVGTGLLKPNLSALLSKFYQATAQREAAFSVFFMSIQVSAVAAPIITGYLGERVNWHAGFGAAAVGMAFGVVQFATGARHFQGVGEHPGMPATSSELAVVRRWAAIGAAAAAVLVGADVWFGTFTIEHVLMALGLVSFIAPPLCWRSLNRAPGMTAQDRERLRAVLWILVSSALFWMVAVQSASLLNLFVLDHVHRAFGAFIVPASWLQSAIPVFILMVAPVLAALWLRLGSRWGYGRSSSWGWFSRGPASSSWPQPSPRPSTAGCRSCGY